MSLSILMHYTHHNPTRYELLSLSSLLISRVRQKTNSNNNKITNSLSRHCCWVALQVNVQQPHTDLSSLQPLASSTLSLVLPASTESCWLRFFPCWSGWLKRDPIWDKEHFQSWQQLLTKETAASCSHPLQIPPIHSLSEFLKAQVEGLCRRRIQKINKAKPLWYHSQFWLLGELLRLSCLWKEWMDGHVLVLTVILGRRRRG